MIQTTEKIEEKEIQSQDKRQNGAENPEKQTAWKCRLDQYPPLILNPPEPGTP